jgi:hypothetical protein
LIQPEIMAGSRRPSLVSHEKKQRMKMPPSCAFTEFAQAIRRPPMP